MVLLFKQLAEEETKWVAALSSSCGMHGCLRACFPTALVNSKKAKMFLHRMTAVWCTDD